VVDKRLFLLQRYEESLEPPNVLRLFNNRNRTVLSRQTINVA
jgi:hypothetical protein